MSVYRTLAIICSTKNKAKPRENRFSASGGVTRTGPIIQVYLGFGRLVDGPPALVE